MYKLPTFSSLHRAMACPASVRFPAVPETEKSEAAERGTALHLFIQECILRRAKKPEEIADDPMLDGYSKYRPDMLAIDIQAIRDLFGDNRLPWIEEAFALDAVKQKCISLGSNIGREYEKHGANQIREFCGSADAVIPYSYDGMYYLADFKTGSSEVEAAESNWQLRGLAASIWRWHMQTYPEIPFKQITAAIIYTNGTVREDVVEWSESDLMGFEAQMRDLIGHIPTEDPKEGDHCRYCPAFQNCPAKADKIKNMGGADIPLFQMAMEHMLKTLGPAHLLKQIKGIREVLDEGERSIRKLADKEPIDLGNGKVYGPSEYTETEIDPATVHQQFGLGVYEGAVSVSVTKTSLLKALKNSSEFQLMTEKDALAKLAQAGGVQTRTRVRYAERKKRS